MPDSTPESETLRQTRQNISSIDSFPSSIVYWKYADEHGTVIRIRCDASIMASETLEKPGLARHAAIDKNHANVKFVKHGSKVWGIAVRDGLTIAPGQEIFRST